MFGAIGALAPVVGTTSSLLALDIVVVILRYQARKMKRQPLMADDWLCFVSLLLASGLATTIFIGRYGC
jgi:hypothetical protein